jgi:hypothetical protein
MLEKLALIFRLPPKQTESFIKLGCFFKLILDACGTSTYDKKCREIHGPAHAIRLLMICMP